MIILFVMQIIVIYYLYNKLSLVMDIHSPEATCLRCPTCLVLFSQQQSYKVHYKSDYHRYNIKRKMVKLSPVTEQQFKAKKNQPKDNDEQSDLQCKQCGKKYSSLKTLEQHARTKKHNSNKLRDDNQSKKSQEVKTLKYTKNCNRCMFCMLQSKNFSENLRHMQSSHSFFIAQSQFCVDMPGLVEYLQQKIDVGFMCITCENKNAKDFNSGQAVRKHMSDKGHTFMKIQQGFDQYLEYYDFSSQFKEIIQHQKNANVPIGIQFTTLKVLKKQKNPINSIAQAQQQQNSEQWEDQNSEQEINDKQRKHSKQVSNEQQQWQSDSSMSERAQQQQQQQEIKQKDVKGNTKAKVRVYKVMRPTHTANGQLLLPNGKILGHRKFRFLYKQNYRSQFWLNQNMKKLGYQFGNNSLISRERLLQLVKYDRFLFKTKTRMDKKQLSVGMQNNSLQKYYRSRNSL